MFGAKVYFISEGNLFFAEWEVQLLGRGYFFFEGMAFGVPSVLCSYALSFYNHIIFLLSSSPGPVLLVFHFILYKALFRLENLVKHPMG